MTLTLDRLAPRSPEVVAALTRRELIAGAGALLVASSCGGAGPDAASAPAGASPTRTITHAAGTTEVPDDPQRIVTLHDQNALLPLLELGVTPVASAGRIGDDGTTTFRRTTGFDTSGIEPVGEYGEPNLEAIAAARPDLIVGNNNAADLYDELSQIAPTVIIQTSGRRLDESLLEFANVVGRQGRGAELLDDYRARIAGLRSTLGAERNRTIVSLLEVGDPGTFFQGDAGNAAPYTVMVDLDLRRPGPQVNGSLEAVSFSLEQLPDHDGDAVLVVDYGNDESPGVSALVDSPLFANLAATRAGQSRVINGRKTVGAPWSQMHGLLDELERILLDPAFDHDVVDEAP